MKNSIFNLASAFQTLANTRQVSNEVGFDWGGFWQRRTNGHLDLPSTCSSLGGSRTDQTESSCPWDSHCSLPCVCHHGLLQGEDADGRQHQSPGWRTLFCTWGICTAPTMEVLPLISFGTGISPNIVLNFIPYKIVWHYRPVRDETWAKGWVFKQSPELWLEFGVLSFLLNAGHFVISVSSPK